MKKSVCLLVTVILLAFSASAAAADKIGFVDVKDVFFQSDAGKKELGVVKTEVEKKRAVLKEMENKLRTLRTELDKQRLVLTKEAYGKKELDYQGKFKDYKRLVEDSNEELGRKEQLIKQRLIPEIVKTAKTIGKKEGYSMILDISSGQYTGVLLYHSEANDLTKKVIEEYNKIYHSKK
ncbi:MAG: OmpH family outer membrane protein [Syntrophaceae bacterium]|nr:OmpH family outer membrane protein [Syntrophaceae bacterium]